MFLCFIICYRISILFTVNELYIDSDQIIMWCGAKDFLEGKFYEPRFYGQDYNSMLESLVAVPFLKIGIPIYKAVPIATHILFLTPYLFTALYLFFKQKKEYAVFTLSILLLMPTGFDVMTSLPRGFVTGLFFTTFYIISFFNPTNLKFIFLNTFLSFLGYIVLPNSLLVSVPFLLYLASINYKNKNYYAITLMASLLAFPMYYYANLFYILNKNYNHFPFTNKFGLKYFVDGIYNLNIRFDLIGPLVEGKSIITLFVFLGLAIIFYKKNKIIFMCYCVFLILIVVTLFSSKSCDGLFWPFFSNSRLYIGIPIFVYLFVIETKINMNKFIYSFIFLTTFYTIFKISTFQSYISKFDTIPNKAPISLNSLAKIKKTTNEFSIISKINNAKLIVCLENNKNDAFINYAGNLLIYDFPLTIKPSFERRTHRIEEEKNKITTRFLIYTSDLNFDITHKSIPVKITKLNYKGLFLVSDNKLTLTIFLDRINVLKNGF